ncbi:hypothetical protein V1515DRAFT_581599 [Lipomyces mesembrius]
MPLRSVHRAQLEIYKDSAQQPDDMSAEARMLRLAIEQAWDPEDGARWGADFVNTVKSIYVPLKSEQADTPIRLSQVRLVELNETATITELEEDGQGITVEKVIDFQNELPTPASPSHRQLKGLHKRDLTVL